MEGRASPKRSREGDAASHVGVAGRRLPMCGLQAGQSVALSRQETAQAKGLSLNQDRSLHVITYTAVGGLRMPHCENPRLCVRALHHLPSEQPWCTVSPGTQTTTSEHVARPQLKAPTNRGRQAASVPSKTFMSKGNILLPTEAQKRAGTSCLLSTSVPQP